jgi:hypothetical protein
LLLPGVRTQQLDLLCPAVGTTPIHVGCTGLFVLCGRSDDGEVGG